jgi:hypothetical protein
MSTLDQAEYDAFGPWIDEVRRPDDVPRLYRGHPIDIDRAELVLKVPRNIVRREADPAMHLYDALIVLEADGLLVLSRAGDTVLTRRVPLVSIVALQNVSLLLDAQLIVHTTEGDPLVVPYNGSARESIDRLVDRMRVLLASRRQAPPAAAVAAPHGVELPSHPRDHSIVGAYSDFAAREPHVELLAAHPTLRLQPSGGALVRAAHAVRPMLLHGAVIATTPGGVHLLHRREWLGRGGQADISEAHTVLIEREDARPLVHEHPLYPDAMVVTLPTGSGGGRFEIVVDKASRSSAALVAALS